MIKRDAGSQSGDTADVYTPGITLLSKSSCYGNRGRDGVTVKENYPGNGGYWLNVLYFFFFKLLGLKGADQPTVRNVWWELLTNSDRALCSPWKSTVPCFSKLFTLLNSSYSTPCIVNEYDIVCYHSIIVDWRGMPIFKTQVEFICFYAVCLWCYHLVSG